MRQGSIPGRLKTTLLALMSAGAMLAQNPAHAQEPAPQLLPGTLEGHLNPYVVKRGDTIVGLATRFAVHPIRIYKPNVVALRDGLEVGEVIHIEQRRVTPRFYKQVSGVVLNIPEAEVYLAAEGKLVKEYPVAVSMTDWKVPIGQTHVVDMTKDPTWFVPPSIQEEMRKNGKEVKTKVPPGPKNPLGPRWIGFWNGGYGLHGTNVPSSIKRYASHGCVRFFPHDIIDLYGRVEVGTPVRVYYQPVLMAVEKEKIWLSVYPDIYETEYDFKGAVLALAKKAGVESLLDERAIARAIKVADGIPVDVAKQVAVPQAAPSPKPTHHVPKPSPSHTPKPQPSKSVDVFPPEELWPEEDVSPEPSPSP